MNAKLRYRLLSALVALCMVLVLFPAVALAAEGDVAQIGDTTYATLDEAVETAEEGATIELLQDCELTKGFNKTLTFTGTGKITINKQLTSNGEGWMCFGLYDPTRVLTFDGSGVEVEWTSDGTAPWLMLSLTGTLSVTNGAKLTFMFDSRTTATRNAIYMNAGSAINVTNGSTLQILGVGTEGNSGQGIQLDSAGTATVRVTGNSTFLIDGTNRGYVNSPTIYVENSTFTVQNCTANASNGGNFTAINSKINYLNNNGHGLSAGNVTIQKSNVNCTGNAYYGITYSGDMTMDGASVINANENGYGYTGGGLCAYGTSTVESGATINILNNKRNGVENYGNFTMADGVKFTVTGNNEPSTNGGGIYNGGTLALPSGAVIMNNHAGQTGGGICNAGTITIPLDVLLYNNHADLAGDDVYNRDSATLNLPTIGSNWVLDDCNHLIDGWYVDAQDARWQAHAAEGEENNITPYEGTSVSGLTALKAAHSLDAKDKTSYPGLDKVIVTEDGTEVDADTAAAGGTVNFKLTTNVPDDLLNYINLPDVDDPSVVNVLADEPVRGSYQLVIHDQMDDELVLDPESFVVMIGDTELALMDEYTIAYDVSHNEDGTCDFEITLDLVNLYEMGAITEEDIDNATPITVTYTATLAEDATAGEYLNTAWVTYPEGESEKDTVTVKTYGISIFKYDQANNAPLSGATFELYQKDDEGNVIEDSVIELTSGENGYAVIEGLDAGTYYLKETQAPEGYVCSEEELTITVPGDAGEGNYVVSVSFANAQVPHTGGAGTLMYTIGGAAIILLAGALLLISRYSRKKQVG